MNQKKKCRNEPVNRVGNECRLQRWEWRKDMAAGIIFVCLIVISVFGIKSYAKWLVRRGCGSGGIQKKKGRKNAS